MGHYLLLLPVLFVAAASIRDDLTSGLIYNQRLLQGLVAGGAVYLLLLLLELAGAAPGLCSAPPAEGGWPWTAVVALNLAVGLAVAILLWVMQIWAAGDAKLFALYAFLVPPAVYTDTYVAGFPALPMLVNVFALVFAYLVLDLLRTGIPAALRGLGDGKRRSVALRAAPRALLKALPLLLSFTAVFAAIRLLRALSREELQPLLGVGDFTLFLILFVAFRPLSRLLTTRAGAIVFSVISAVALLMMGFRHGVAALPELMAPSAMAVALLLFARAYPKLGESSRRTTVGRLEPGVVLSQETLVILLAREQQEVAGLGDDAPAPDAEPPGSTARPSRLGSLTADGLTPEQVRYIRTRYDDDETIAISRTLPFSPFLAAGALLTWGLGGAVTGWITRGGG